jgi:CheY-like chemotaxis protein
VNARFKWNADIGERGIDYKHLLPIGLINITIAQVLSQEGFRPHPNWIQPSQALSKLTAEGRSAMLRILIVENDAQLAETLKYLIEENAYYCVVGLADDTESAIAAAEMHEPDIVLLDLQLARGSTGFMVAARLADLYIPVLFVSGNAPNFPMPDLALGCLAKPVTAEDVHCSLAIVEDILRGRNTLRRKLPANLTLYDTEEDTQDDETGFVPSNVSLKTRLTHWVTRHYAGKEGLVQ